MPPPIKFPPGSRGPMMLLVVTAVRSIMALVHVTGMPPPASGNCAEMAADISPAADGVARGSNAAAAAAVIAVGEAVPPVPFATKVLVAWVASAVSGTAPAATVTGVPGNPLPDTGLEVVTVTPLRALSIIQRTPVTPLTATTESVTRDAVDTVRVKGVARARL